MEYSTNQERFISQATKRGLSEEEIDFCLRYSEKLQKQGYPLIFDELHLSKLVGYKIKYIRKACYYQLPYYRKFSIKKKKGGTRDILEPLPSLKHIQTWILKNILVHIPVSRYSKAYQKNSSVFKHAFLHKNQDVILSMDIQDFFQNITEEMVFDVFSKLGYTNHLSGILCRLCSIKIKENDHFKMITTEKSFLPQGAPTSPMISNVILFEFDEEIGSKVISNGGRYSRYADDITISGNADFDFENAKKEIELKLDQFGFCLNNTKTKLMKRNHRQFVTGVVVNEKVQLSKKDRRHIRQAHYYIMSVGLDNHLKKIGEQRKNYLEHLIGRVNFGLQMNPHDKELSEIKKDLLKV